MVAHSLAAEDTSFVTYKFTGGLSPYQHVDVNIERSGHTRVHAEKQRPPVLSYETDLSNEELAALHALVRASGFFSEPDGDIQSVTDAGNTELIITESDRHRTLKFSHRPSLDPLIGFVWKLVAQGEAFAALQNDNLYDVGGALAASDSRRKALQPYKFKAPLMTYFYSCNDRRRKSKALQILAPMTTVDEFAGLVASLMASNSEKPFLIPAWAPSNAHRLAACPLYLGYLKEHFSQPVDYTRENYDLAISLASELADMRYEPAIPYFLQLLDAHTENRVTSDLFPLSAMGSLTLVQLTHRLENKDETQRLAAIELLALAARHNPINPISNPVSAYEFEEMRKIFNRIVLPKLASLEGDPIEAVRQKAAVSSMQIVRELTKKDKLSGPFVKLTIEPDHTLRRTLLADEEQKSVSWRIMRDAKPIIQDAANGRIEYKCSDQTPAVYTAYVSAWVQGRRAFRGGSNIIVLQAKQESSPAR